jgi:hypothetical protein
LLAEHTEIWAEAPSLPHQALGLGASAGETVAAKRLRCCVNLSLEAAIIGAGCADLEIGIAKSETSIKFRETSSSRQVLLIAQSLLGVQAFFRGITTLAKTFRRDNFGKRQGYASAPSGRRTQLRR